MFNPVPGHHSQAFTFQRSFCLAMPGRNRPTACATLSTTARLWGGFLFFQGRGQWQLGQIERRLIRLIFGGRNRRVMICLELPPSNILRQSQSLYGCWLLKGAFSQPLKAKTTTAKAPNAKPGNTPGIVKLLLPPRQSRGVSRFD